MGFLRLLIVFVSHHGSNQIKSYPTPIQVGNRVFVVTAYFANADGKLTAEIPTICPKRHHDDEPCRISVNHHRERTTGPCFPLTVVECDTHHIYFTLYPFGHFPYGRHSLTADISVTGNKIINESIDIHDPENKLVIFQGTLFGAALDAGFSKIWPKESILGSIQSRYNTQLHHLDRTSRLLGIHSALDFKQIEEIAEILNLPGQVISENLSELRRQQTSKKQGQEICKLLMTLPQTLSLFEPLTEAGSTAALWPTPCFWNHVTKRMKSGSFHRARIRGSP